MHGRRRVDHHVVELGQQLLDQQAEGGPLHQLERVGRQRAHRQHEQRGQLLDLVDQVVFRAAGQQVAQARGVGHAKQQVLARRAHVGIEQQRAPPELAQADGHVGREVGLAVTAVGAEHGQRAAGAAGRQHTHHQLAAQLAKGLGLFAEGLGGGHQLVVEWRFFASGVGVVKLLRQRPQHIVAGGELERDGSLAKTQAVGTLVLQHLADLRLGQAAGLANVVTNGAAVHLVFQSRGGVGRREGGFAVHRAGRGKAA